MSFWQRQICGKVDKFGAEMKLSFNKLQYHGTCWGGIFTLVMYGLVVFGISYYSEDLIYRRSPQTIYSQESIKQPERMEMANETFTVSFGIEDSLTWDHIIDTSIYTVSAVNRKRYKMFNTTSQEFYFEEHYIDLNPKMCDMSQFKVPNTFEYYQNLAGVKNQYCFTYPKYTVDMKKQDPQGRKGVNIEGDFTADVFSQIEIEFRSCKNHTLQEADELRRQGKEVVICKPQSEIDLHLQSSYIGMYLTTQNFDPNNYENPFSHSGQDLFWPVSNSLSKYISVLFKNTYIQTNKGLFFNEIEIQKGFQFASDKEQVILPVDNKFAYINLRFQKGVQDRIFRKYKSVGQVIAEIGGIATFLRILGFMVVYPISKLQLRKNVINELFTFKKRSNSFTKKRNTVTFNRIAQQIPSPQQKKNTNISNCNSKSKNQQSPQLNNYMNSKDYEQNNFPELYLDEVEIIEKMPNNSTHNNNQSNNESIQNKSKNNYIGEQLVFNQSKNQYLVQQNLNNDTQYQNQGVQATENTVAMNRNHTQTNLFLSTQKLAQRSNNKNKCMTAIIQTQNQSIGGGVENQNFKIDENNMRQFAQRNFKCKNTQEYYDQIFKSKEENMQLSLFEYLLYYFVPCVKRIKAKKDKIDFCNQIITQQLDGVYILKKLLELEKLKSLLLNEDQLKLFEYIPKPTIDDEIVTTQTEKSSQKSNQNKKKQTEHRSSLQQSPSIMNRNGNGNRSSLSFQSKQEQHQILNNNQFNILKLEIKTEEQKSKEAYEALLQIKQKEKLSRKDIKILQMIDPAFNFATQLNTSYQEEKRYEFSPYVINNNNTEMANMNDILDKKGEGLSSLSRLPTNITPYLNNTKINKLNQVQKSIGMIQDVQEENGLPVEMNNQSNSYVINFEQFSEQSPDGIQYPQNIDASAAKLYTMQFSIPLKKFSSKAPIKNKEESNISDSPIEDNTPK